MKKISLSFVIPTFNDETTIALVIERAVVIGKKYCSHYEIVVTNDASIDKTPTILKNLSRKYPTLRILTHTINKGYGETIKELYYEARYEWLFSLPGDFQIDPSEVITLLPFTEDADMIIGKRERRNDALLRQFQSKVYNFLLWALLQLPTTDVNSVRLMKTSIVKTIKLISKTPFVDAELVLKAHLHHFRIKEVPINHKPRTGGVGTGGNLMTTILPTLKDLIVCAFTKD